MVNATKCYSEGIYGDTVSEIDYRYECGSPRAVGSQDGNPTTEAKLHADVLQGGLRGPRVGEGDIVHLQHRPAARMHAGTSRKGKISMKYKQTSTR